MRTIDIIFFKQSLQGVLAARFAERFSKKYSFKQYWGWRGREDGRDGRVTIER